MNDDFLPPGFPDLDDETRRLLDDNQRSQPEYQSEQLKKLDDKLNSLSVLTEALWLLLTQRSKLTDADLTEAITTVAQKRKAQEETKLSCRKCRMKSPATHKRCVYCGGELEGKVEKGLFP